MPYNPSVARFKADMLSLTKNVADNYHDTVSNIADEVIENMRSRAPVITGALRDSIRKQDVTQKGAFGLRGQLMRVSFLIRCGGKSTTRQYKRTAGYEREVKIGSGDTKGIKRKAGGAGVTVDYAHFVEFGTAKMGSEPFFYVSYRDYKQAGQEQFRETMERTLEENNRVRALRSQNYSNGGFTSSHGHRGAVVLKK
jgi:HK97 gp10 family phage protein